MGLIAKWNTDTLLSMKLYVNVIVDKMKFRGYNVIVFTIKPDSVILVGVFDNIGNP